MRKIWVAFVACAVIGSTVGLATSVALPAAADAPPDAVGVVSDLPVGFIDDGGGGGIDCPTAHDCWIAGRYPPIGGASNQWDAAVVHLHDGVPDLPLVVPGDPYTAANDVACWSADDCVIATMAPTGDGTSFGPGYAVVRDGVVSSPTYLGMGLTGGGSIAVDSAGTTCALVGLGNVPPSGPFPGFDTDFFVVGINDGVAGVPVREATRQLFAVDCISTGCVVAGGAGDHGFVAPFDGTQIQGEASLGAGYVQVNGLACSGPADCLVIASTSGNPDPQIVVQVHGGTATRTTITGLPGPFSGARGITCDSTLASCLVVGSSSGSSGHAFVVPVLAGTPGVPRVMSDMEVLRGVSCATASDCLAVADDVDVHGSQTIHLVTGLALPVSASVAPGWLSTETLSTPAELVNNMAPGVGYDAAGNAYVATVTGAFPNRQVVLRTRPPLGPWGAPQAVPGATGNIGAIDFAVNAAGDVVLGWGDGVTHVVRRPAGGSWSAASAWSSPGTTGPSSGCALAPSVAIGPDGTAAIAWATYDKCNGNVTPWRVLASGFTPATGWQATPEVWDTSTSDAHLGPDVAIDDDGSVVVVFTGRRPNPADDVYTVERTGTTWGAPVLRSASNTGVVIQGRPVAAAARGTVVIGWQRTSQVFQLMTRRLGAWDTTTTSLPGFSDGSFPPSVAVGKDGAAVVSYGTQNPSEVFVATRSTTGVVDTARVSTPGITSYHSTVAANAAGDLVVGYTAGSNPQTGYAVTRPNGGSWSVPTQATGGAEQELNLGVAVDVNGHGLIAGVRRGINGNASAVDLQTTIYAGTPPAVATPTTMTPANADVGDVVTCQPGTFSGTATFTYTTVWTQNGAAIPGASGSTFSVRPEDAGRSLRCLVTARNEAGTATAAALQVPGVRILTTRENLLASGEAALGDVNAGYDASGRAYLAYIRGTGFSRQVVLLERPPSGPWGAPQVVPGLSGLIGDIDLAVNPAGDLVLAFRNGDIGAMVRPAGGSWTAPRTWSSPGSSGIGCGLVPDVAAGADGSAVVTWATYNSCNGNVTQWRVLGIAYSSTTGWEAAPQVWDTSESDVHTHPVVAVEADGTAVVAFGARTSNPNIERVWVAQHSATGWTAPAVALGGSGTLQRMPSIATDGTTTAIAVYRGSGVDVVTRTAGGPWTQVATLAGNTLAGVNGPAVAVSGGRVAVSYRRATGNGGELLLAEGPASGPLTSGPLGTATTDGNSPSLAFDQAGDLFATWDVFTSSGRLNVTNLRPAGGTFAATPYQVTTALSSNDTLPQLVTDPFGHALVAATPMGSNGLPTSLDVRIYVRDPITAPSTPATITPVAAVDGDVLTCSASGFGGTPPFVRSYEWLVDGAVIPGASTATFTARVADVGHALTCRITARNEGGSLVTSSAPVSPTPADVDVPVITITSPADGTNLSLGQVVVADYACQDSGSGVAVCTGDLADGAPLDTSAAGDFSFHVVSVDHRGNATSLVHHFSVLAGDASEHVSGGETVSTDPGGVGPSPEVPVQTQIVVPPDTAGDLTITPEPPSAPPAGFAFFGQQMQIDGPVAPSASQPYVVTFTADGSVLGGTAPADVQVFRNGTLVTGCTHATDAAPDPCVSGRGFVPGGNGDAFVTVRTTHFSEWVLGEALPPVVVTAGNATRPVGAANPAFTVGYSGFLGSDGPSSLGGTLTCTTTATTTSHAGQYPITCSGLTSDSYAISYVAGILTVTPAPTSIITTSVGIVRSLLTVKVTFSARLTSSVTGSGLPGQAVDFRVLGPSPVCSAVTDSSGRATCSVFVLPTALLLLLTPTTKATFPGSGDYLTSSSSAPTSLL